MENANINKASTIKSIHSNHRERIKNRFIKNGLDGFAEHEVLELLLFYTIPRKDVNPIAHNLLTEFGTIENVLNAKEKALTKVSGVGKNSAVFFNLLNQVYNKYINANSKQIKLSTTAVTKDYCKRLFTETNVEQFFVINLNASNNVISQKLINTGTSNKVEINIRQITDFALSNKCERIILVHNHTTDRSMPSDEDIAFTRSIICSCMLNDIDVVDHVIVSNSNTTSFAELNVLNTIKQSAFNTMPIPAKAKKAKIFTANNYLVD